MPKPDRLFRERPLEEVERLLARVKPVLLFHPEPIVVQGLAKMCVCRKGERKMGKKSTQMIQCDECFEWFHFDCAGVGDDSEAAEADWKCHWCTDGGISTMEIESQSAQEAPCSGYPTLQGLCKE